MLLSQNSSWAQKYQRKKRLARGYFKKILFFVKKGELET